MVPVSHPGLLLLLLLLAFLGLAIGGLSTVWPADLSPSLGCARLLCCRPSPRAFQASSWCLGAAEQGSGFARKPPRAPGIGAQARAELPRPTGGAEKGAGFRRHGAEPEGLLCGLEPRSGVPGPLGPSGSARPQLFPKSGPTYPVCFGQLGRIHRPPTYRGG